MIFRRTFRTYLYDIFGVLFGLRFMVFWLAFRSDVYDILACFLDSGLRYFGLLFDLM